MTDYFIDDSVAGGSNDGSSWDNAYNAGTQVDWTNAATSASVAGDRIIFGSTNSTLLTADLNFSANSNHTKLDPLVILCSTKAGSGTAVVPVPFQSSGNGEIDGNSGARHVSWAGNIYIQGLRWQDVDGTNIVTTSSTVILDRSLISFDKSSSAETHALGNAATLILLDSDLNLANSNQVIAVTNDSSNIQIIGGSISTDSNVVRLILISSDRSLILEGVGVDLQGIDSGTDLVQNLGAGPEALEVNFVNSKLPSTMFTLYGSAQTNIPVLGQVRVSGEQGEIFAEYKTGNLLTETTIFREGGASVGSGPFSIKMESSSAASRTVPLRHVFAISNPGDLDTLNIKVNFAQNSGSPATDEQIWLEAYAQTSGGVTSDIERLLIGASATNHPDESGNVDWRNGGGALTGYEEQSCNITITEATTGILYVVLCVAADFKTTNNLYADPFPVIS